MPHSFSIRLMGGFEARHADGAALALKGRKTQALLAILALAGGEPVGRDRLVNLLWSDRGEEQGRGSLRQALAELRRALGDKAEILDAGRDSVTLATSALDCDVLKVLQAAASKDATLLDEAAGLCQGELLAGFTIADPGFEDWLEEERRRVSDGAGRVLECVLEKRSVAGEPGPTAEAARQLLDIDPLRESVHRSLMALYAQSGERAKALKQYEDCRRLLRETLDVEPEAETKELAESIRKGGYPTQGSSDPTPVPKSQDRTTPPAGYEKPAIAVLPFTNLSDDPEQQYFSDGITEDITTELNRFGSLTVLARHSTFVLRDQAQDIHQALIDLGADYLLEGSIRRAGKRIRLTARLVDVHGKNEVWANRYDRELEDVFAIQDELVHAIVATLVGRVESSRMEQALRKPPESLEAYDYYLRALRWERGYDPKDIAAGIEVLERAIELDPGLARAYGLLATYKMMEVWFNAVVLGFHDEPLHLAKKAIELDPTDGDCFAKLGIIYLDRREHEEARRYLEKALSLNPHEPSTWSHYAWYLVAVGKPEESLAYLDQREEIDPYPPNWTLDLRAEACYDLGRYEEAARILESKDALYHYNYGQLACCYGQLDRKKDAARCWKIFKDGLHEESGYTATFDAVGLANSYQRQEDIDHWSEGLRKAGLSE